MLDSIKNRFQPDMAVDYLCEARTISLTPLQIGYQKYHFFSRLRVWTTDGIMLPHDKIIYFH